jgi:hypothetical protein
MSGTLDLSSSTGRGFVVSRQQIVLPPTAGRGRQAQGKLGSVAVAASLGLYILSGMSTPAAASRHRHHHAYAYAASSDLGSESRGWHRSHRRGGSAEKAESGRPEPAKQPPGPLILAVSIGSQRVTVYDNGTPIAVSPISTGMAGHPTPMGVFSVIQKQRWHRSNLYSNAPMPYMQRITWSGVAMHAGVVPGYPASHGCIRLPERFAVRLWSMTKVGARVIVTRGDSAPYEISHPRLAGLVKNPEAASTSGPGASDRGTLGTSDQNTSNARSSATTGAVVVATADAATTDVAGTGEVHDRSEHSVSEVNGSSSKQGEGAASPDNRPVETGPKVEPSVVEPIPTPKIPDALQRSGPISLFVSRKEGKLFVRKGFAPVFDTPITIVRPEVPLGTHVFTANRSMDEGSGLRWLAVSIGSDRTAGGQAHAKRKARAARDERPMPLTAEALHQAAVEALDRIELPPEALERIIPLVAPGASLLISDQGLGGETGKDTDFIVVTK